jgi:hypothetical protein
LISSSPRIREALPPGKLLLTAWITLHSPIGTEPRARRGWASAVARARGFYMIRSASLLLSVCLSSLILAAGASGCGAGGGGGDGDTGSGDGDGDGDIDLGSGTGRPIDTNGDGQFDGIDLNGDGVADYTGTPIDSNNDGIADGIDVDGDGVIDYRFATGNRVQGCNDLQVEFESVTPTVLVLVDRSSSMFDIPLPPYANRWEPLKEALVGPDGAITNLQSGIRFGFAAYTHQAQNGAGACPIFDATNIALNNYDAIKAEYDAVSSDPIDPSAPLVGGINPTKGETPTGAAIQAAAAQLAAFTEFGPKFILLVTDGEPDTCTQPDPQCGQDQSIAAAQAAFSQGIGTFAIGVGEIGLQHLQDLANAGTGQAVQQRPEPLDCPMGSFTLGSYSPTGGTARVFNPGNPEALKADIAGIVGSVRSCTYTMNAEVDSTKAHLGTVLVNGQTAVYENENGWRLKSSTEVEILGSACQTVKTSAQPDVYISFPCDAYVIR